MFSTSQRFFQVIKAPVLAIFVVLIPMTASAQSVDREAVEQIVREYLLQNPELMLEVQDALQARQEAARAEAQKATLTSKRDAIYASPNQMVIGNPDAEYTVVVFLDYKFGNCRRAHDNKNKNVDEHPDVKFIMKEFPVLGKSSLGAHQISLALIRLSPELYSDFHRELLGSDGQKDATAALNVAADLGADTDALLAEAEKPWINEAIREVYDIADGLGISGTPSYIVGEEVIFGAVGYDQLMTRVKDLRECGKAVC